jgi:predicted transcriptional regulator
LARTIDLKDSERRALALIAAKYDTSSADIIHTAISALITTEMQHDKILAMAIARAVGVSWEQLEQLKSLDDLAAGQTLTAAM